MPLCSNEICFDVQRVVAVLCFCFCSWFSYWALMCAPLTPRTPFDPKPPPLVSHCIVLAYLKLNCLLNVLMRLKCPPFFCGNISWRLSSKQSVSTHSHFLWRRVLLFCRILFIAFTPSTLVERSIKLSFNFDCAWLWPACEINIGKVADEATMIYECPSVFWDSKLYKNGNK